MTSENIGTVKTTATLNLLAGIWLFASPWVYAVSSLRNAWNGWIVGALIVLFAAIRVSSPVNARGVSIVNMVLGIWTFLSPWMFGYAHGGRFVNSLIVGGIVFILGAIGSTIGRTTTLPPPVRP